MNECIVNKTITTVIPNYNGSDLLRKNLPTVLSAIRSYGNESSLIVVDDGSSDDSLDVLNQEFPNVKVIVHLKNKGFADAVHSGVKEAATDLVFILNSDVQLNENFFPPLVSYFEDENTFSVNPLIYDEKGEVKRHSWNYRQFRKGSISLLKWTLQEAKGIINAGRRCPTMYGHGGSMLVRKSMFDALGGFDPIFKPYYGEDSDIGIRAWRRGWYSYFEPRSSIVHQSIGSIRANVKMKQVKCIRRRNRYILEWIHLTPDQLIFIAIPMSLFQLLGELVTIDLVNLKGFLLALTKIPDVMNARARLKGTDRLGIKKVLKVIGEKTVS
ncbi:MAG: glycosyltransferase [Methylophilaceae bacterium]|nr:glycosyltransferase [Methylophilaceae bacterium]